MHRHSAVKSIESSKLFAENQARQNKAQLKNSYSPDFQIGKKKTKLSETKHQCRPGNTNKRDLIDEGQNKNGILIEKTKRSPMWGINIVIVTVRPTRLRSFSGK